MAELNLRREIKLALRDVWPVFWSKHPAIAPLFDRALVLDAVVDRFRDDPEYLHVMADAMAARVPYQQLMILIRRLTTNSLELAVRA